MVNQILKYIVYSLVIASVVLGVSIPAQAQSGLGSGSSPHELFSQLTSNSIMTVTWNPDGTVVALGNRQGQLMLVDANGKIIASWVAHASGIYGADWNSDGTQLATGGVTETKIWNSTTGELLTTLPNDAGVITLDWFHSQDTLFIKEFDSIINVKIYDTTTWNTIYSSGTWGAIFASAVSPDGQLWATSNVRPASIEIRNPCTFERSYYLGTNPDGPSGNAAGRAIMVLAWSPDGTRIVSGATRYVTLWDTTTSGHSSQLFEVFGTTRSDDEYLPNLIEAVWFTSDGNTFASVTGDGTVRIWETATGNLLQERQLGISVSAAAISPDRSQLAIGKADGTFQIIDLTQLF